METESSLSFSQELSNGPYREAGESSPCHPMIFLSDLCNIILHIRPLFSIVLFPSGLHTHILYALHFPVRASLPADITPLDFMFLIVCVEEFMLWRSS
jgi:hypothetical protein